MESKVIPHASSRTTFIRRTILVVADNFKMKQIQEIYPWILLYTKVRAELGICGQGGVYILINRPIRTIMI